MDKYKIAKIELFRYFELSIVLIILCALSGCGASAKENSDAKLDSIRAESNRADSIRADSIRAAEMLRQQDSIKVAEILLSIDNDLQTKKRQMLEKYPDFGSVNNINSRTVNRAIDYLESGEDGFVSISIGVELDILYTKANIDTWYINELNKELPLSTKVDLANEYIELNELTKHVGLVFSRISDPVPESHGPSSEAADGELRVYKLWHKSIKAEMSLSKRVTADKAALFADKLRKQWNKSYKDCEDEISMSYLKQRNIEVKQTINTISSLTKEKQPYAWFVDECLRNLDVLW